MTFAVNNAAIQTAAAMQSHISTRNMSIPGQADPTVDTTGLSEQMKMIMSMDKTQLSVFNLPFLGDPFSDPQMCLSENEYNIIV
jgi:hypothetical protein